ncbi:MAG TPA: N-methyl-L-tryptophan oxidase [Usitatibacter sp.]|nr:N-methyl-L-tryptophan oxidase [Usitatibacter sp.]
MDSFDAIVVGLGAAGAATLYQLARRGARVLGIDRFDPPHDLGSSHGDTRITRLAIGEGDAYVPLAMRSHEIWRELEARTGRRLLAVTGGLWISGPSRQAETHVAHFFDNTLAAARRFGIAHEILDAAAIRSRFPQFAVADNEVGYYEPQAGFVRPEACIAAQLELARSHGATIRTLETVGEISQQGGVARVLTDRGKHEASRVILCAGAWLPRFLPASHARHFTVTRQVLHWFETRGDAGRFEAPAFPVFIWELRSRRNVIYGFPAIDGAAGGLKVATERYEGRVDPDALERKTVSAAETRAMYEDLVAPHLPGLGPRCVKAVSCLYTATPDFHFAIGPHPALPNVIVASPCSGHGFKHSAALGEALAELASGARPRADLAPFALARLGG